VMFGLMVAYLHTGVRGRIALIGAVLTLWGGFFAYAECVFRRNPQATP